MELFSTKGTSKAHLDGILQHTASLLPQPNCLPTSFKRLLSSISEELITIHKVHVCVNDCTFFEDDRTTECPKCGETRYRQEDSLGRKTARKVFSHTSIKEMLELLFSCKNIAQVIQSAGGCQRQNVVTDILETNIWQSWMSEDEELKVVLGFNTDGVNPYHGSGAKYSCWPLVFAIFNLPKHIRNKTDALLLYGVAPSKDARLGNGLEPELVIYQNRMVDELLQLSSTRLYDAYSAAPLCIKLELLIYMMDFQGYSKYFRMSGVASLLPCNRCLIPSTRVRTNAYAPGSQPKYKRVITGHDAYRTVPARDYEVEVLI